MPLPTPSLDDRRFQDIVDQAKTLIPRYCPEWTDHNVSDPGVTLIELFAWMTDMLLYRVNQVPDKMYITFLELLGIRLEPPRAARGPITFILSAPQPNEITIPEGTEVATIRTETNPAIVFTTESDLTVRPPDLQGVYTRSLAAGEGSGWIVHDLRTVDITRSSIPIFSPEPVAGDAFYLRFESDLSNHVIALRIECELAGGAGVDPDDPPIEWQAWQGGPERWVACEMEFDGTGGFNRSGEVVFHVSRVSRNVIEGEDGFWLRCRLLDPRPEQGAYRVSPDLTGLQAESRGGTMFARQATTVRSESLGTSDGSYGQTFQLARTPVLARDSSSDHLLVRQPGGIEERWEEVTDFSESGPEDRHYTLDTIDGTITLGPSLLQPDGSVYAFGAVPARGSSFAFSRYQYGGGVIGNVPAGAISVLKSSIPYVARITNRRAAIGGQDAETLENAKLRAPLMLRTRTRAVTADDFETLALQVPGVARAHCLSPGAQPGEQTDPRPGQVFLLVIPEAASESVQSRPEPLALSAELRSAVLEHLNGRRLLTTALEVRQPQYVTVSVTGTLRVAEGRDSFTVDEVGVRATDALYRYLNPYRGGPNGTGWPFGRALNVSEVFGLLQGIDGVEFIEELHVRVQESGPNSTPRAAPPRLEIPGHAVIVSGSHELDVR